MANITENKEKKSFFAKVKEIFFELKKVTWPTGKTVVKQTSVVIAVVLFFLLVTIGIDSFLGWLYSILTSGLGV